MLFRAIYVHKVYVIWMEGIMLPQIERRLRHIRKF